MSTAAGLDIGSRTVECVVIDTARGRVLASERIDTGPNLAADCRRLLDAQRFDRLVVTGYGRALAEVEFDAPSITEIKAAARGARALFPNCRTVLDIGGQDTKVIALDDAGRPRRFEMNDRCAAGAGRFLELMAGALGYQLSAFGAASRAGRNGVQLSSMCAVFAESEVVGLVTRGVPREDIARAVHSSIVQRTVGMLRRVSVHPPVAFVGGGARNAGLVQLLAEALACDLQVSEDPQMAGALGAALIAAARGDDK
jgi:predicted CoA-substrate-specific enzyme activase